MRHAAPSNSAIYLDLTEDLVRRVSPAVAMAREEIVPQEMPVSPPEF